MTGGAGHGPAGGFLPGGRPLPVGPNPPVGLSLPVHGDLDAAAALRWLAAHTTPGVDLVADGTYRRTTADGVLVVEPVPGGATVLVRIAGARGSRPPSPVELTQVRFALDLDRDMDAVQAALRRDPVLGPLVELRPGLRVMGGWSPWEALVRVVVGQQVSVPGARTLAGRLAQIAGTPVAGGATGLDRLFPGPAELLATDLGPVGLTGARRRTLEGLAGAVTRGRVPAGPDGDPGGGDRWLEALSHEFGIGPWTLSYLAMRVVRDPDAWPVGDLVLRRACTAFGLDVRSGVPHLSPWRAYAATHLWEATWGQPAG